MQTDNSKFDDTFGNVLKKNLKQHVEPKRSGFTEHVLKQVELLEEQKLLRSVVWQGRLVLGACVAFCAALLLAAVIYPELVNGILSLPGKLFDVVVAAESAVKTYWQVLAACVLVVGMWTYNFVQVRLARS